MRFTVSVCNTRIQTLCFIGFIVLIELAKTCNGWYNFFGQRRMWRFSFRGDPGSPQSRVPNFLFLQLLTRIARYESTRLKTLLSKALGLFSDAE